MLKVLLPAMAAAAAAFAPPSVTPASYRFSLRLSSPSPASATSWPCRSGSFAGDRAVRKRQCRGLSMQAKGFSASSSSSGKKKEKAVKTPAPPQQMQGVTTTAALEKFDLPDGSIFMGAWRMLDESICDDLIHCFENNPRGQLRGMISMKGGSEPVVDKSIKDSLEMSFAPNDPHPAWQKYLATLKQVMAKYLEEYPMAGAYGSFGLISRSNFQYYPAGGGYKTFHTERTGGGQPEGSRHLVFMTYLNDVDDAGGTEFYHQKITVQPKKGLTLVWPADWTFTHRGVPSPSQEKRIVTGWFNFVS